ncbi:hypothetical protein KJ903_03790, partial [Patescibacteria group bacterium]|nr:hypothetical protein [Patescibacteria group bacterium]
GANRDPILPQAEVVSGRIEVRQEHGCDQVIVHPRLDGPLGGISPVTSQLTAYLTASHLFVKSFSKLHWICKRNDHLSSSPPGILLVSIFQRLADNMTIGSVCQ